MSGHRIIEGDCIEQMQKLDEASVDAIVTDPPYSLGFMSKPWDMNVQHEQWAREALRVVKPGGHLIAFGGTRTYHRLAVAIEDAGFEIRDTINWLYGSGFPKSLNVGRAMEDDRGQAADFLHREAAAWSGHGTALKPAHEPILMARKPVEGTVVGNVREHATGALNINATRVGLSEGEDDPTAARYEYGFSEEAKKALGTVVASEKESGFSGDMPRRALKNVPASPSNTDSEITYGEYGTGEGRVGTGFDPTMGRWPPDMILGHHPDCEQIGVEEVNSDGHFPAARGPSGLYAEESGFQGHEGLDERHMAGERQEVWRCVEGCPVAELNQQSGERPGFGSGGVRKREGERVAIGAGLHSKGDRSELYGDSGGASRFFPTFQLTPFDYAPFHYVAKASRREREAGLDDLPVGDRHEPTKERRTTGKGLGALPRCPEHDSPLPSGSNSYECGCPTVGRGEPDNQVGVRNVHPTVKPIGLAKWLSRLVCPPEGTILDPFAGSGSLGIGAILEGFDWIGIERDADYVRICEARLDWWSQFPPGTGVEAAIKSAERARKVRESGQLSLDG